MMRVSLHLHIAPLNHAGIAANTIAGVNERAGTVLVGGRWGDCVAEKWVRSGWDGETQEWWWGAFAAVVNFLERNKKLTWLISSALRFVPESNDEKHVRPKSLKYWSFGSN